ncbi:MAG: hypothetical protein CMJ19_15505 [Phycisphaeraceae bacterium]|nr:hypothetical protein [Phycisphaeraceae bacterium]
MLPKVEALQTDDNHGFIYRKFQQKTFPFVWHIHRELELTWIATGKGNRYVGDHVEPFTENDLVLLGSNLPHTWHSLPMKKSVESVVIQFSPQFTGEAFESLPEMRRVTRLLKRCRSGLAFSGPTAIEAGKQMQAMEQMPPMQRLTTFLNLLDRLAGCRKVRELASPTFTQVSRPQDRSRMEKLYAFIHQNYDQPIGLPDAAEVVSMNPTSFARYFRQMTGQSFVNYMHQLRIGHVCRQLIESDEPITDICYRNGFGTLSNFNRIFARIKGCTPRIYRKRYTQEDYRQTRLP